MAQEITLTFSEKELDNLKYALNCASIEAFDNGHADWHLELLYLWRRIYLAQKLCNYD